MEVRPTNHLGALGDGGIMTSERVTPPAATSERASRFAATSERATPPAAASERATRSSSARGHGSCTSCSTPPGSSCRGSTRCTSIWPGRGPAAAGAISNGSDGWPSRRRRRWDPRRPPDAPLSPRSSASRRKRRGCGPPWTARGSARLPRRLRGDGRYRGRSPGTRPEAPTEVDGPWASRRQDSTSGTTARTRSSVPPPWRAIRRSPCAKGTRPSPERASGTRATPRRTAERAAHTLPAPTRTGAEGPSRGLAGPGRSSVGGRPDAAVVSPRRASTAPARLSERCRFGLLPRARCVQPRRRAVESPGAGRGDRGHRRDPRVKGASR